VPIVESAMWPTPCSVNNATRTSTCAVTSVARLGDRRQQGQVRGRATAPAGGCAVSALVSTPRSLPALGRAKARAPTARRAPAPRSVRWPARQGWSGRAEQ